MAPPAVILTQSEAAVQHFTRTFNEQTGHCRGQLGPLPAKIVDQQLLELFRLDSRHFRAFLFAEHDRLADEVVQHDVVQNGVDVEQPYLSIAR